MAVLPDNCNFQKMWFCPVLTETQTATAAVCEETGR